MHTDLNVGMYWGDMGIDFSQAATWKQEIDKHEVSWVEAASLIIRLFFFISVFLCNHLHLLASSYVFKFRVFTCLYLCFKVLFKNLSSIGQLFFYYPKGGNILNYNNQNILWEAQNKEKNKTVFNGYWLAC